MRVVHVSPTPFGAGGLLGGGERYPLELCRALAASVEVELVTFGRRPGLRREAGGLWMRTVRRAGRLRRHPAHPLAPGLPWALRGADLVHTHQTRSAPSRLAALAARVQGTPAVTTDHGLGGGGWCGLLPALFRLHLTVSEHAADTLDLPAGRTRVVYGGVDPDRFHPGAAGGARRDGVLFVGRLTPHKGVDRLLRALPPGAGLTIAGSAGHDRRPPERDYVQLLRGLATGRDVRFTGPVSDAELPALHASPAVLVLPSVHRTCYGRDVAISELLGLVVLEAMASGTPVVASRVGGVPELVRDGETGFLVEPGDVVELRERLAELLADRALAERFGARARDLVLERFTWSHCARRCLDAYEEVVRDPSARAAAEGPTAAGAPGTGREER